MTSYDFSRASLLKFFIYWVARVALYAFLSLQSFKTMDSAIYNFYRKCDRNV